MMGIMHISQLSVLMFATIWRHVDNLMPAMRLIKLHGGRVDGMFIPFAGDPDSPKKLPYVDLTFTDTRFISATNLTEFHEKLDLDTTCNKIMSMIKEHRSNCVLLPNNFLPPYSLIYTRLKELGCNVPVIAVQHGLQQPWHMHYETETCDVFLAYGPMHVPEAKRLARYGAVDVGLPKLDRLFELKRQPYNEIIVFADPPRPTWPNDAAYINAIKHLASYTGASVSIRSHPMYRMDPELENLMVPAQYDRVNDASIEDLLKTTRCAVGTHSTALLEAMQAGVPTVILPHYQWKVGFPGYEGVAKSLDPLEVSVAISKVESHPEIADNFLQSAVGGRRGDHAQRFHVALREAIALVRERTR